MTWDELIKEYEEAEFNALFNLRCFLEKERSAGKTIYPEEKDTFKALELTPFENVKVIILGQDPYYNPGQAMGLAFSVPKGTEKPPSLQNIFKELRKDLGIPDAESGDLSDWARQGVLLLNTTLTVEKGRPLSHSKKGWGKFTAFLLDKVAQDEKPKVFLLWGKKSHELLQTQKFHKNCLVLKCGHPSPLSYRFYMDNNHFSISNNFLKSKGLYPINWNLNEV